MTHKKRFSTNIKFVKYLYEGFVGSDPLILEEYISKYGKRKLNQQEEELLFEFIEQDKSSKFYSSIYSSLQILIDRIIKENYNPDELLYEIIENFPSYIDIDKKLNIFLKKNIEFYKDEKLFTTDSLITIFEIFEALCWKEISRQICFDYKINIPEENKIRILQYFEDNKDEGKLINKRNLTSALRKFISRCIANTRQDNIKSEMNLINMIIREDFWDQSILGDDNYDNFYIELSNILNQITVGNAFELYHILDGDNLLDKKNP